MAEQCEQEMCPFWTGDGCACRVLGIGQEERDAQREWIEGLHG